MDVVGEKCNLSNRFKNGKPKVSVPLPKARVDAHSCKRFSQAPQTDPQPSEAILETRDNLREKVPEGNCACSCESVSKLDVKVLTDHDGNKTQMSQRHQWTVTLTSGSSEFHILTPENLILSFP